MLPSGNPVILSRVLVPLLCLVVWAFFYLHARCAYRLPKGGKRTTSMLALVFGAVGIFALQVSLMGIPAPGSDGKGFFLFVLIEVGGGLVLGFYTLLRERSKSKAMVPDNSNINRDR